jgi:hypothetical protein
MTYYSIGGDIIIYRMYERKGIRKPMPLTFEKFKSLLQEGIRPMVQQNTDLLAVTGPSCSTPIPVNHEVYEAASDSIVNAALVNVLGWTQEDADKFRTELDDTIGEIREFIHLYARDFARVQESAVQA